MRTCFWKARQALVSLHTNSAMTVQFSNVSSALGFIAYAEASPLGQTYSSCKKMIYVL